MPAYATLLRWLRHYATRRCRYREICCRYADEADADIVVYLPLRLLIFHLAAAILNDYAVPAIILR